MSDPGLASGVTHLFLELPDYLGSTSIVIDHDTSELVEAATYQAYGATESDYRPARWDSFREDYQFTGKEEDAQIGLEYFGKRYLHPALGRWTSADPLTLHRPSKSELLDRDNLYGYVTGHAFVAIDDSGLEEERLAPPRPIIIPEFESEPPRPPTISSSRWLTLGFQGLPETISDPKQLPRLQKLVIRGQFEPAGGYVIAPAGEQVRPRVDENGVRLQAHHGMMTEMAMAYIYRCTVDASPTILMTAEQHVEINTLWNSLRLRMLESGDLPRVGQTKMVDWARAPEGLARVMATSVMNGIDHPVPKAVQDAYWKEFDAYKANQAYRKQYDDYVQQQAEYQQSRQQLDKPRT